MEISRVSRRRTANGVRRAVRRVVGVVAAATTTAVVLVPLAIADSPASAWVHRSGSTVCSNYPRQATVSVELDDVPEAYRAPLNDAVTAWNAWSRVTGVTVRAVTRPVPAGTIPVAVSTVATVSDGTAYAGVAQRCAATGGPASARLKIGLDLMGPASTGLKRKVLTHELGHVLGLGDNYDHEFCASIMRSGTNEDNYCSDRPGPYPDDIAGVLALWQPQLTRGFPANSRIVHPAYASSDGYLKGNDLGGASGWWGLKWRAADTDGLSDWTFVPDSAAPTSGWGWIVNSASGLCLARGRFEQATTTWCQGDEARWGLGTRPAGTALRNKAASTCIGMINSEEVITDARLIACNKPEATLRITQASTTRTKRSLPDAVTPGGPIVGWGSQRCVTVNGGARVAGTGLSLRGCDASAVQKWAFHPEADGYSLAVYTLADDGSPSPDDTTEGDRVDTALCAEGSGSTVSVARCAPSAAQTWTFSANGTIRNKATGSCLNVSGGAVADQSPLILYGCGTASNETWSTPDSLRKGVVSLATVSAQGTVIGTSPAPAGDGDTRVRTALTQNASQASARWVFVDVDGSNGGGLLKNLDTGTCLRWRARSAQVALDAACNGSDSSYRWAPSVQANGAMALQSQYTGECLDASGRSSADGAAVITYSCNGGSNQLWRSVPTLQTPGAPTVADRVDVNLAMFGTAWQSSTYSGSHLGGAEAAIDGVANGSFYAGSVTSTNEDTYAWWQVDLEQAFPIEKVTLYNRTDCCSDRSKDLWVLFSPTPFPAGTAPQDMLGVAGLVGYRVTDNTGPTLTVKPADGTYRYVRVQVAGRNWLSLAEVSVTERR